ncbi:unnamed protein product [Brachionus calyciflorus]|uniref:Uncharacterized protein n=1 Tax=Brachionus calyciflorus TaxID=104777 RepID=A0A813M5X0_9BILA|nr:unnamed protein product [Brachionus calyciflorus]
MELTKNKSTDIILRSNNSQNDYEQQISMLTNQNKAYSLKKTSKFYQILFFIFLIICGILVILLITTFYSLIQTQKKLSIALNPFSKEPKLRKLFIENEPKVECKTEACYKATNFILDNLNTSADPCVNFNQFSCGKWLSEQPNDKDHFTIAYDKMLVGISDLFKSNINTDDSELYKNMKILYQSCLNQNHIQNNSDIEFFTYIFKEFGSWPLLENQIQSNQFLTDTHFGFEKILSKLQGLQMPFLFSFLSDEFDSKIIMNINFPKDYCKFQNFYPKSNTTRSKFIKMYKNFLDLIKDSLNIEKNSHSNFDEQIDEMLQVAHRIYFINSDLYQCGRRRGPHEYIKKTIDELDTLFNQNKTNFFNFKKYVNFLNEKATRQIDSNTQVVMFKLTFEYLTNLLKSLNELNLSSSQFQRGFMNLVHFHIIYSILKPSEVFSTPHIDIILPIRYYHNLYQYSKHTGRLNPMENLEMIYKFSREKICANSVLDSFNTPDTEERKELQNLFLTKKFDLSLKNQSNLIFSKLLETTYEVIGKQKWIDENTKSLIEKRLKMMEHKMLFSDEVLQPKKNFSSHNLTSSYVMNKLIMRQYAYSRDFDMVGVEQKNRLHDKEHIFDIFEANLLNIERHNVLLIPAGVLIEPIFNQNNPIYLNYATFGSFMAHEIFHLISDILLHYSSEQTRDNYINKVHCLIDNYEKYTKMYYGFEIDGTNSMQEQISDNFGFLIGFKTFLKEMEMNAHMSDILLPGINYTPEQLFFIRYSQSYCRKRDKLSQKDFEKYHVIHEYRSFQVSLIPEFKDTFKCSSNVFMNLTQCKIFDI